MTSFELYTAFNLYSNTSSVETIQSCEIIISPPRDEHLPVLRNTHDPFRFLKLVDLNMVSGWFILAICTVYEFHLHEKDYQILILEFKEKKSSPLYKYIQSM